MKIGIDARLWNQTGVGRYIRNLVNGLDNLQTSHEFYIYLLEKDYKTLKFNSSKMHKRVADVRWHTVSEQIKFPKIIAKDDLDLMHFTYYSVPYFFNKPYVITLHDLIIYHFMTGEASTLPLPLYRVKHIAYKSLLTRVSKTAKKIIVPLDATKKDVVKLFPNTKDNIVVTKEGFDKDLNKNGTVPDEIKLLSNEKYFLYVGNAYPHKNVKKLINAFKKWNTKEVKLILVGKDDYFYSKLRENVINENIVFLNNVSDAELAMFYKSSLALVNPSLMEGFGLPVLEAMSLNSPVLVSDIPAFREVCGDAAIYFDPKNEDEIMKGLDKILSQSKSEKEKRLNIGKERASQFSWETMVKQTLEVYESIKY